MRILFGWRFSGVKRRSSSKVAYTGIGPTELSIDWPPLPSAQPPMMLSQYLWLAAETPDASTEEVPEDDE